MLWRDWGFNATVPITHDTQRIKQSNPTTTVELESTILGIVRKRWAKPIHRNNLLRLTESIIRNQVDERRMINAIRLSIVNLDVRIRMLERNLQNGTTSIKKETSRAV